MYERIRIGYLFCTEKCARIASGDIVRLQERNMIPRRISAYLEEQAK